VEVRGKLKKRDSRWHLNIAVHNVPLQGEFQIEGPPTEKALSPLSPCAQYS